MCVIFNWLAENASWISDLATVVGVVYVACQYCAHKEQEKTAILSRYNERYATDPNIYKVVNYLLWKENPQYTNDEGTEINKTLYGGEKEDDIKPTRNQVEMFMRFIEELQISIDAERLDSSIAKPLFAYYADKIDSCYNEELETTEDWLPEDYSKDTWQYFHKFVGRKTNKTK